ncbi:hypothetical protein PHLGIDRAFT_123362 [Phlebiopsis gigantea 11061_1 CR5-6]|uniref:AAA protein C-terminal winged helix domain-containing protein n=1 Tax=Phlebiopsis gigantea (strain 11061_1 CR5-6) TaxID=745531 RepID=A0A0C3P9N8_PHLG1|nr:hypothetical protein PHLGIDRAFT_123362 [Phlebiopsis gigantea 11061_1 CR5-6]
MQIIIVNDVDQNQALEALKRTRQNAGEAEEPDAVYRDVVQTVGGRLSHLEHVSRQTDMRTFTQELLHTEKSWLISQIGLLPDPGEEMSEKARQSLNTWTLLRAFVEKLLIQESEVERPLTTGAVLQKARYNLIMPQLPYYQCCRIMRYPEHLEELDRASIISMNTNQDVRIHSLLVLRAATDIIEGVHFQERFAAIEKTLRSRASA